MVGLNGAGKTTSSAKLANWLKKQGQAAAADRVRFASAGGDRAARDARPADRCAGLHAAAGEKDVLKIGQGGAGVGEGADTATLQIFDTAGRQEIDEALIEEIKRLQGVPPAAGSAARGGFRDRPAGGQCGHAFSRGAEITGLILTKLDGDARGGAALSMREVTQRPIKFAGVGEKLDQFEPFYPGSARRADPRDGRHRRRWWRRRRRRSTRTRRKRMEEKMRTATFDLNDFLAQFKMIRKLGPLGKYPCDAARDGQPEGLFG